MPIRCQEQNLAFDSRSLKSKAHNFTLNLHLTSFYILTNIIMLSLSCVVMHTFHPNSITLLGTGVISYTVGESPFASASLLPTGLVYGSKYLSTTSVSNHPIQVPSGCAYNELINYLINYHKSYFVQFGQTRVFLIAVYEHSKATMG
jgi:hypothetical protein